MRMTFTIHAGPHEQYTKEAARSLIGQRPKLNMRDYDGGPVTMDLGEAVIVAAEVTDDGRSLFITYESDAITLRT